MVEAFSHFVLGHICYFDHTYGLFIEYGPDFYIFKHLRAVDAGDTDIVPGDPAASFQRCETRVGTGTHLAARLFVEVLAAMAWRKRG